MRLSILLLLFVVVAFVSIARADDDPYQVLGISRRSSQRDIKRAYKALAREWHPDKNDSPEAQGKFVQINRAYEVLSDPIAKERYDKFGTFEEPSRAARGGGGGFGHFDDFFAGFGFGRSDESYFTRHRVTMRMFATSLLERSYEQPFLIYAYSSYCQWCFRLEPRWKEIVEALEPLGYGIGTVNAMMDGNVLEQLRVDRVPAIVALVDGRAMHFRGSFQNFNPKAVRAFARDALPVGTLMDTISTHAQLRRLLDQWTSSDKTAILIVGSEEKPRLRYLLTAMKYQNWARFAYLPDAAFAAEASAIRSALNLNACTRCDAILAFNEWPEDGPVARLVQSDAAKPFTTEEIGKFVDVNKLLTFPKIASPSIFDELCPVSTSRQGRKLCIFVPSDGSSDAQKTIAVWRDFVRLQGKASSTKFGWIDVNKQSQFLEPFTEHYKPKPSDVLVVWRVEYVRARFAWIPTEFVGVDVRGLTAVLDDTIRLERGAEIRKPADEHALSWFTRLARRTTRLLEVAWFHVSKEEVYPVLSVVGSFIVILLIGYGLSYLTSSSSSSTNSQDAKQTRRSPNSSTASTAPKPGGEKTSSDWHPEDPTTQRVDAKVAAQRREEARLARIQREMKLLTHELCAETYFGMIRLLKPGCRSLVLLVDEQSKPRLLAQFAQFVYPLRNNKTFSFGYLMVERNLPFFRKLLEHTLPADEGVDSQSIDTTTTYGSDSGGGALERSGNGAETSGKRETSTASAAQKTLYQRLKSINPRQTVGTVLVLCGWKLYFSIYHPMHAPAGTKHFLGFDDDGEQATSSSSSESNDDLDSDPDAVVGKLKKQNPRKPRRSQHTVSIDNVLNGFPNWLDRLLEGSIRRYYIPEWPDNLR